MSLIAPTKCIIEGCPFNTHPILADKFTTRNHILHTHSHQEKKKAAQKLGIYETNPYRLAEILTEFSRRRKIE